MPWRGKSRKIMHVDSYEKVQQGVPKGKPYDGPPPLAGFVVVIDGREVWCEQVSERGMGRRVKVLRAVAIGEVAA